MVVILVALAIIAALASALFVSQATAGVAILAGACLLAILARIAQASDHHNEIKRWMRPAPSIEGPPPTDGPPDRQGGWTCEECGYLNSRYRDMCKQCRVQRAAKA